MQTITLAKGCCLNAVNAAEDQVDPNASFYRWHLIAGIDLAGRFYTELVRALVRPRHAACLLGEGSEVLGYDQPRSTDHAWGPRLQIFVTAAEVETVAHAIERGLPAEFRGWPVRFFRLQTGTVTITSKSRHSMIGCAVSSASTRGGN